MSEQDQEKSRIAKLNGKEKGIAMCNYFRRFTIPVVKSQVSIVKPVVKWNEVFDGGLPLESFQN
jgi:uncharacterized protein YhbP (UPF0306 family)